MDGKRGDEFGPLPPPDDATSGFREPELFVFLGE